MINTSLSIEYNSNISKIHNMKSSFIPNNTINLNDINKEIQYKSKKKKKNSPTKSYFKKPLTIITNNHSFWKIE